ncbi:MAG: transposase [Dehalococcoidia bacterium]|nr:transposase [Dehalococcoidia bacterium]
MNDRPFPRRTRLPPGVYENRGLTFHLILRAWPGTRPFRGPVGAAVWHSVMNERTRDAVDLLAACLMPDHLHVAVRPARLSIPRWVQSFKPHTTKLAIDRRHGRNLWQPRYYDRVVREGELTTLIAYIVNNPLAAGLAEELDEWPWTWSDSAD